MIKLLPSILSADFANLEKNLKVIENAGVDMVHIDVMDGVFVPSISLGMPVIQSIRKVSSLCFDVHLMVVDPERYIEDIVAAGANIVGVHVEACKHLHRTIMQIKEAGARACVVLNPATPLEKLEYVLEEVDTVLIMTVNPGFGGQSYIPSMTRKIRKLREMILENDLNVKIQVDGGIKLTNVREVLEAGADYIVAGSSVFGENAEEQVKEFHKIFKEYQ
ncbi:ribulose-phosphate 3-epimerase [Anaeromicropila herbilytica]|uniref:Ribulose-phosphate 3-epimerase n=1 Tax=Anaeromicropila herbilytica TaxID=2785025 RepID=A0A7R7EID6_9FIRM|nr:ribulose-phosphate 3-epimerase [Anaeromicropila herbilytica]BCN29337.1 ribulose-phosphate 3-epimerase [Anaeromicropila herbilytica]